jgi:CheY-like chemotaxis protein
VDDTEANLYVAKLLMVPYGLQIHTATSGYEAIALIRDGQAYDILFMDHMMPKMNGMEATRIIRDLGYAAPIIALTANAVVGQADIFLTNGFDGFIAKPIDMRLLDVTLNKYIYDKQPPEVIAAAEREQKKLEEDRAGTRPPEAAPEARQAAGWNALPDIAWLNTGRGLALFDYETDTYLSALRSYVKNVPDTISTLRVVTEESLPEYAANIHALKSISGWIAADGIRARAASLETLAKEGNFPGVTALHKELLDEIETLISDLRAQLADEK